MKKHWFDNFIPGRENYSDFFKYKGQYFRAEKKTPYGCAFKFYEEDKERAGLKKKEYIGYRSVEHVFFKERGLALKDEEDRKKKKFLDDLGDW